MITLIRTNSANKDFIKLVKKLDAFLAITDGEDHAFYNQFNKLNTIKYVLVAYSNNIPVGCGAIKEFNTTTVEIKRMFTSKKTRGQGVASKILLELEKWALELNFKRCILETGIRQIEAIGLYKKNKYQQIDNYGQYAGIKESLCFEKNVND